MNMPKATADRAAARLWNLWKDQRTIDALPEDERPSTLDEGWQIQRSLDAHAGAHAGWKLAATSPAGQRSIGADGPVLGRLYDHSIVPPGSTLSVEHMAMRLAEAEFAFTIARDIDPDAGPLTRDRVLDSIATLHPAIEVPDSRFTDFRTVGLPSLVADAMGVAFLVVGEPTSAWNASDLPGLAVTMYSNGISASTGSGMDVLGDPLEALLWSAIELDRRGLMLREGDVVTTGGCTPLIAVVAGDRLVADFGELGQVDVTFD